jgi:hypothetical protein
VVGLHDAVTKVMVGAVTLTIAGPNAPGSATLVAFTVICVPGVTPVVDKTPPELIVPADADHVTAVFVVFVRVAEQVEGSPSATDVGKHETLTETAGVTVMLAVPDLVVSSVEVAVIVAMPDTGTVTGAV